MGWANAVQGGSAILGGILGNQAADAQGDAAQAQQDWIRQVYGDAQGNFAPYLQAGQGGLNGLSALMGGDYSGFMNSPDYLASQKAMQYGQEHGAAARGRLFSGGFASDLANANADHASGYLNNYRNHLMGVAGMGLQGAGALGGIGTGTMGPMGQALGAQGDARANGLGSIFGGLAGLGGAFGASGGGGQSSYGSTTPNNFGIPLPGSGSQWNTGWGG